MIRVRVDPAKQRIDLKIDQPVGEADLQRVLQEVTAGIREMRPGWVMACDFRGLTIVDPKLNSYVVEVQKAVLAASPRKIATLVDSHLLKLQLQMGANVAHSKDITQRFDNEQAWRAYSEAP